MRVRGGKRLSAAEPCTQDHFHVLSLALDWVTDADTLACVATASSDCGRLVQAHIQRELPSFVTREMQRQNQRLEEHRAQQQEPVVASHVVQTKPLEWLCTKAGRGVVSQPSVAQVVLQQLPLLPHDVLYILTKTLAQGGLQLSDEVLVQAAKEHTPWMRNLAIVLYHNSCYEAATGSKTGLSCLYAAVLTGDKESISKYRKQLTASNLPDLLLVACSYSSARTLQVLANTAMQHKRDEVMPQLGVQHAAPSHAGSVVSAAVPDMAGTLFSLCERCISHHGCAKLRVLVSLPEAASIDAAAVQRLMNLVLDCVHDDLTDTPAQYINALAHLKAVRDISASDILTTLLACLRRAISTTDTLRSLLSLPQPRQFTTPQILELVVEASKAAGYEELIEDLDELLLGRDVGRVETLQLARQLMELHADRLQDFLGAMASINLQAVLDPDDIHSLLQQAVELRNYDDVTMLLELDKASQMSGAAIVALARQLGGQYQAPQADISPEVYEKVAAVLQAVLQLLASAQDGEQLVLSALEGRCEHFFAILKEAPAIKQAWEEIHADTLAPILVGAFQDSDSLDDFVIEEIINHPAMAKMSPVQLGNVLRAGFRARSRADTICSKRALSAEEQRAAEDILQTRVSSDRMAKLLALPGTLLIPTSLLHECVATSLRMCDACFTPLFSEAGSPEFAEVLVSKLIQRAVHCPWEGTDELEQVLAMPVMKQLAPDVVASFMQSWINSMASGSEVLRLLARLPGAQELPSTEIDKLMQLIGPPGMWGSYNEILMQLPNADVYVVGEHKADDDTPTIDTLLGLQYQFNNKQQPGHSTASHQRIQLLPSTLRARDRRF